MARDKSIQTPSNLHIIFGCEAFIHYYCWETVLIRGNQTFTNMWCYFPPFFNEDSLQFGKILRISLVNLLQRSPKIFNWIEVGDLLGHMRTLIVFLVNHFDSKLAVCFGSLSCWKSTSVSRKNLLHSELDSSLKFGDTWYHPSFHRQYGVPHFHTQRINPKPLYCHLRASLLVWCSLGYTLCPSSSRREELL